MMRMENEYLEDVCKKIRINKERIEQEIGGTPLFGAVGGSVSFNLANKSSDIDFYLAVRKTQRKETVVETKKIELSDVVVDFMCVPVEKLILACNEYCNADRKYPTIFYRSKKEEELIKQNRDVERPDFKREMVGRIYLADRLLEFEPDSARENYKDLKEACKRIDIWDSYFNRAYGNYHEKIKDSDRIQLRKYLYTISEVTVCRLLTERHEKPVLDFRQMFSYPYCPYKDSEIIKICNKLWDENRKSNIDKVEAHISPIEDLNQWLEIQLEELVDEMQKKEDYLRNTYLPYE